MSEGLAHGPYMEARAGFEPATLWTEDTELTAEPPHPTLLSVIGSVINMRIKLHVVSDMSSFIHTNGPCS